MTGDSAFNKKLYAKAIKLYSKDLETVSGDTASAAIAFKIAESYRNANRISDAQRWYKESIKYGMNDEAFFFYADMLKRSGKYYQAIDAFNEYIERPTADKTKANIAVLGCKLAMEWVNEPSTDYVVESSPELNTEFSDYAPSYMGDKLVFTSHRKKSSGAVIYGWNGEKFSDFFITDIDGDGKPGIVTSFDRSNIINTKYNEGTSTFTPDTSEIYFTRCGSDKQFEIQYCKIFRSRKKADGTWEPAQIVQIFTDIDNSLTDIILRDDTFNIGQPSISSDGKFLYFSTDRHGGYGGNDIYYCEKKLGMWGSPINMGPEINTQGDEMYPFRHIDGKFYFCSDGHIGMGGLDIFEAEEKGDEWQIYNMKSPLNSGADDFGLVLRNDEILDESGYYVTRGFFTSTRDGGVGGDDIYSFSMVKDAFYFLNVEVYDKVLQNASDPNSRVVDYSPLSNATIEIYGDETLVERAVSAEDGKLKYKLRPNMEYRVMASKPGYLNKSEFVPPVNYSTEKNKIINVDVEIIMDKSLESGTFITVNNIYYDFDAFYIREEAGRELDSLSNLIKDNPQLIKIELGSHTDSRGSYAYNEKLSQKRAESCVKYLLSKGIDASRLSAKGYGEIQLVNKCTDGIECTEEQHQRNRRTTFKVLMENYELVSQEPEQIITDFAPESARGVVAVEDRESVEDMLKKYEDDLEDKSKEKDEDIEFVDDPVIENENTPQENEIPEQNSTNGVDEISSDENNAEDNNSSEQNTKEEIEPDENIEKGDTPDFQEEYEIPVFSQNDDGDIEMKGEKDGATDSGGMLDDFLDDNNKKDDGITSDNVEWDYVDKKETNPKEIIVKVKKNLSVNCVISAKYKEKKEYLFVLTNEDTLIEQTVDKQMFKTFEEGDEVIYKKLEKGFKIVKK